MLKLSPHFTLAEFTVTNSGLGNVPTLTQIRRLGTLALFMEKPREILGHPIEVTSAFRSPEVNAAAGGVSNSAHELCYAADFVCPRFGTPYQICMALIKARGQKKIAFDQLILEPGWVHLSRDPRLRGELWTMHGGVYRAGIHP